MREGSFSVLGDSFGASLGGPGASLGEVIAWEMGEVLFRGITNSRGEEFLRSWVVVESELERGDFSRGEVSEDSVSLVAVGGGFFWEECLFRFPRGEEGRLGKERLIPGEVIGGEKEMGVEEVESRGFPEIALPPLLCLVSPPPPPIEPTPLPFLLNSIGAEVWDREMGGVVGGVAESERPLPATPVEGNGLGPPLGAEKEEGVVNARAGLLKRVREGEGSSLEFLRRCMENNPSI